MIFIRICKVEGCNNIHEAKGYCGRHYRSLRRYGDPLQVEENPTRKPNKASYKIIDGIEYKTCTSCMNWFEKSVSSFYNSKNTKDGLTSQCKHCLREKGRKRYENKRDYLVQWQRDWYANNKEIKKKQTKRWANENYDRKKSKEKEWQENNLEKLRVYRLHRNANKKHEISEIEWEACLKYFNFKCAYCGMDQAKSIEKYGQVLHKEHVDHYGNNDLSNNIPACKGCNSKKRTKTLQKFAQDYDIDEERLELIEKWIQEDYLVFVES